jgi:uncharacterized protein
MIRTDDTYIRTYSGLKAWPLQLRPEDVTLRDIAHALSNLCRFTGHVREFYSVAQHCILMRQWNVTPCEAGVLLLHDAAEAYLNDIASPVKRQLKLTAPAWARAERQAEECIFNKYISGWKTIRGTIYSDYREMDRLLLTLEIRQLLTHEQTDDQTPTSLHIIPWLPNKAEEIFLAIAGDLHLPED